MLTRSGLLEILQNNNALLDQIQKCLEAYLESKRVVFPRYIEIHNLLLIFLYLIFVNCYCIC